MYQDFENAYLVKTGVTSGCVKEAGVGDYVLSKKTYSKGSDLRT